jgi:brefeldin A-resistance guanine nucleotide exchange factor 1
MSISLIYFETDNVFLNFLQVKFTTAVQGPTEEEWTKPTVPPTNNRGKITVPYGIPCVRELFRFLVSLINPHEKQNSEVMIHLGLKLLLVSVETGVEALAKHTPIMAQVKNELCKNLIALLSYFPPPSSGSSGSSSVLLYVLRILFIIYETLRYSLKYQLEVFLTKIGELINESGGITGTGSGQQVQGKWNYEQREIALGMLNL